MQIPITSEFENVRSRICRRRNAQIIGRRPGYLYLVIAQRYPAAYFSGDLTDNFIFEIDPKNKVQPFSLERFVCNKYFDENRLDLYTRFKDQQFVCLAIDLDRCNRIITGRILNIKIFPGDQIRLIQPCYSQINI